MALTEVAIKKLLPREREYQVVDKNGLFLLVSPKGGGGKWWRVRYFLNGKKSIMSIGTWPEVSLAEARKKSLEIRNMVNNNIDPKNPHQLQEKDKTFRAVALEWYDSMLNSWSPAYCKKQKIRLDSGILPILGDLRIADMVPADYLACYRRAEARGLLETAHKYAHICNQISKFAMISGYCKFDVASGLSTVLKRQQVRHFATITDPMEVGNLLLDIDSYVDRSPVKYALQIMPYVFVRSSELRGARWAELDMKERLWTIPAERMKMRKAHVVPLADQVIDLFEELREKTGDGELVFPGYLNKAKPISDVAMSTTLRRLGYSREKMTVHGFRAMASTLLNEMKYHPDVIETQLAHSQGNAVREAYNRARYLEDRITMMQEWADYLDKLRDQAFRP